MNMFRSFMTLLLVSLSTLSMTEATPKERLKVKYKVKTGVKGERMKVGEEEQEEKEEAPYLQRGEGAEALHGEDRVEAAPERLQLGPGGGGGEEGGRGRGGGEEKRRI